MKHANFDKFPKDYKTFAELAEYARRRAIHSAGRNGHQEFAYWHGIREWALREACYGDEARALRGLFEAACTNVQVCASTCRFDDAASAYARAVHCRQMLLNRGEKPPRLSLKWLREAAERL